MWRDLLGSREIAWRLMVRDISAKYRQSLLGIAWAFLPSIVMAVGFTLANNARVINIGFTGLPYPAYVMFSTALWQTFVEALNGPVQAVTMAKPMLARVNFPREALILSKMGEVFFNFVYLVSHSCRLDSNFNSSFINSFSFVGNFNRAVIGSIGGVVSRCIERAKYAYRLLAISDPCSLPSPQGWNF